VIHGPASKVLKSVRLTEDGLIILISC